MTSASGRPVGNVEPRIVVIIGAQRSGTTALGSALAAAPFTSYAGEVFHDVRGPQDNHASRDFLNDPAANFFSFKENLIKRLPSLIYPSSDNQRAIWTMFINHLFCLNDTKWIVSVKYNSLHHLDSIWRDPLQWTGFFHLLNEGGVPIIHLTRRDLFAQAVSECRANATAVFHSDTYGKEDNVTLLPALIERRMTETQHAKKHITNLLEFYPNCLQLDYEDVFAYEQVAPAVLLRLAEHIASEPAPAQAVRLRKLAKKPLRETIANAAEVRAFFDGHALQPYIEKHLG